MPVATLEEVSTTLERRMGLKTHAIRRQTRWRPTWFVQGEREGEPMNVVVRGERVDTCVFPLRHEVTFHTMLHERGVPLPKVHMWIEELDAVVMEMVSGKPDFAGIATAERDVIVDEYLQALAHAHRLEVQPFIDAGIYHAASPDQSAMAGHLRMEQIFRAAKNQPDPFMEFCLGFLHRNPPQSHGRQAAVPWDTGQFHHHDGHLVALLDMEFGHVGDPMMDLAIWRMRDTLIPFGDFKQLYARFEVLSGQPVDLEAIKRHHFAATIGNQLMFGPAVTAPVPETDLMNNMQWNSETNLHATEALGEFLDIELPSVETPEARRTRVDRTFDHFEGSLRRAETDDDLLRHDLRLMFRMARHLSRVNQIGDALEQDNLDDLKPLLGYRPDDWYEGDMALERFVLADAKIGRHDEALVKLFHRRNLRTHMQLGPEGSSMVKHYSTQRFD